MGIQFTKDGKCHLICDDCYTVLEADIENSNKMPKSNVRCDECYEKHIDGKTLYKIYVDEGYGTKWDALVWAVNPDEATTQINFHHPCAKITNVVEISNEIIEEWRKLGYKP
jgi:hypothetical protein